MDIRGVDRTGWPSASRMDMNAAGVEGLSGERRVTIRDLPTALELSIETVHSRTANGRSRFVPQRNFETPAKM